MQTENQGQDVFEVRGAEAGETVTLSLDDGQAVSLDFNADDVADAVMTDSGSLIITLNNGGTVVIENADGASIEYADGSDLNIQTADAGDSSEPAFTADLMEIAEISPASGPDQDEMALMALKNIAPAAGGEVNLDAAIITMPEAG